MSIEKAVEDKVAAGKELSAEEITSVLQDEGAVDGFKPPIIESEETTVGKDDKPEDQTEAGQAAAKQKEDEAAAKKKEEEAAAAKPDVNINMSKLEEDLAKPEDQVDLTGYTPVESAYYKRMRMDRKIRQVVEGERDAERLKNIKLERELATLKGTKADDKPAAETVLDRLKKKDPTDFLTNAEVIEILEAQQKERAAPAKEEKPAGDAPAGPDPMVLNYLIMCDDKARVAHPDDYDAVMELTDEILNVNPKYLTEVHKAIAAGTNPAEKTYELIKADPAFAGLFPAAQVKAAAKQKSKQKKEEKTVVKTPEELKKEKDALDAQKKLEENATKTKTTGNISTTDDKKDTGEYTIEDIAKMSDLTFARLPKRVRNFWLEKMREED